MNDTDMLWIVPSRSRPQNIARLIKGWNQTRCYADLLVVIDLDDPAQDEYHEVLSGAQHWASYSEILERKMLSWKLNHYAASLAKDYDFIGFMGDDHLPRTPIWDGLMGAQLRKMGTGIVYANDLFQGENLPTSVCMSTDIISAIGYMIPPTIEHLYCDNFWKTLGQATGTLVYREDIIIEHIHPHAKKAESDAQYERVNSARQDEHDRNAFETYKRKQFAADIQKVKGLK